MTAFYMFRLMGLTFWGKCRVDPHVEPNIHESPPVDDGAADPARDPVDLPRASSSRARAAARPLGSDGPGLLAAWLEPVFAPGEALLGAPRRAFQLFGIDGALIIVSVAVAAIGMSPAWRLFGVELGRSAGRRDPERVRSLTAGSRSSTAPR